MKNCLLVFIFLLISSCYLIAQQGSLDNSFGINGIVSSSFAGLNNIQANSVLLQSDGKILVGGRSYVTVGSNEGIIVRYNSNGTIDNSFGSQGMVKIGTECIKMLIQTDGKILIADYTGIYRLKASGATDNTFGNNNGYVETINAINIFGRSIGLQSDGKIIVGGHTVSGSSKFAVARYTTVGALDNSFGDNGTLAITFNTYNLASCYTVLVQKDDKIILGGTASKNIAPYINDFALVRLNSNGLIDNTFLGGTTVIDEGDGIIYSAALQSDGKIVVVGEIEDLASGYSKIAIIRYYINGLIDKTFGVNGKLIPSLSSGDSGAKSLLVQLDDKILVGGNLFNINNNTKDFALLKLTKEGVLDNSFGSNGVVSTNFGIDCIDIALSIAMQNDGKIILAGRSALNNKTNFGIARYLNSISVATNDNNTENGIIVYPNPFSDKIFFTNAERIEEIEIFDMLGKSIYQQKNISNGVDLEILANELYLVKIQTLDKNIITRKVTKIK